MATTKMGRHRGNLEVSRLEHTPNEEIRKVLNLPQIDEVGTAYYETRGEQSRTQSHELGATRCQKTVTAKEDAETSDQTGHEGCGGGGIGRTLDLCRWG